MVKNRERMEVTLIKVVSRISRIVTQQPVAKLHIL